MKLRPIASLSATISVVESWSPKMFPVAHSKSALKYIPAKAWEAPEKPEKTWPYDELWLDLRHADVTFAQMALTQLFYSVRHVVDTAGLSLPKGAGVDGVLYSLDWDPADALGSGLPVYVALGPEDSSGARSASRGGHSDVAEVSLSTVSSISEWATITTSGGKLASEPGEKLMAVALPPNPSLWATALTGKFIDDSGRTPTSTTPGVARQGIIERSGMEAPRSS